MDDSCGNCVFGTSSNSGICKDSPPTCANSGCAPKTSNSACSHVHLTQLLDHAGIPWKAYAEGVTAGGSGLCPIANDSANNYAAKHVPFVFFQDVSGNPPSKSASYCEQHVVDYSQFKGDLAAGNGARYGFITPNRCDDGHDSCPPTNDKIAQIDGWLKNDPGVQALITYVTAPANHAILLILWDEGSAPNPQPMLLVAPPATLANAGKANGTVLSHSANLKSLQEIFQLDPGHVDPTTSAPYPWLRHAGDSGLNDYSSFFQSGQFP